MAGELVPHAGERLLMVAEVAQRLSVSPRKTWRLISEGLLPAVRVGLRGTRVREADLETFISALMKPSRN
jgi:excisionase family DNA binding protein